MRALLLGLASLLSVACSKPVPPTFIPTHVLVTAVSPTSLALEVRLDATNPNAIDIPIREATAHVVIDKRIEVGVGTVDPKVTLPANQTTEVKLAVSVPWTDISPLMSLALSDQRSYSYSVDGDVSLGGDLLHVTVPFHLDGKVSREQLVNATLNSIPQIPGVTAPPAATLGPHGRTMR